MHCGHANWVLFVTTDEPSRRVPSVATLQIFSTAARHEQWPSPRCWLASLGVVACRRDAGRARAPARGAARPPGRAPRRRPRRKRHARPRPRRAAARGGLPPERRALQVVDGQDRIVDADVARARGPDAGRSLRRLGAAHLRRRHVAADGAVLPNRYRTVFVGLASNKTDGDGQPLSPGEQNYLELYGIPPTLSVLRERFLADARAPAIRPSTSASCWRSTRSRPGARRRSRRSWPSSTRASSGWRRRA